MELWDLYDCNMKLVKENHLSTEKIPKGWYHLSVEIWPFDGQSFFLTRRSMSKKSYPGYWECTGGSARSGETFAAAAVREVKEELGLQIPEGQLLELGREVRDRHIVTVFLLPIPAQQEFSLESCEIIEGRWYTVQQIESLHFDMDFVPHQFERYLKYVRHYTFEQYMNQKPVAIQRLLERHLELRVPKRGLPYAGSRPDGKPFSPQLNEINEAFLIYGDTLYAQNTLLPENVNHSLGSGSPLLSPPFPPITEGITRELSTFSLSQYPFPAGDISLRKIVCEYLHQEGFSHHLTPENIIFTLSTTHAFDMILRLLLRPGDVVLFTAPTYGLFAFAPERLGGETRFVELSEEDNWLINPDKLERCIIEQNSILEQNAQKVGGKPSRVVAFFHENPHNPTGKVIGHKQKVLLKQIAEVCRRNGVLLIDDLLYRDLGYDRENLALPVASFDDEYQNTISLMGLSKAYGVAGIRAGIIVADEVFVRGIRNMIFQEVDSASHLNAVALASAFCASPERNVAYHTYFSDLLDQYQFNFALVEAVVDGVNTVNSQFRQRVVSFVHECLAQDDLADWWLSGMEQVHFIRRLMPESGFFCILDFTSLRGKACDGVVIRDDISLLTYLFRRYRVNFITGKSMGWPNKEQIVARISYSAEPSKIITVFRYIKSEIERLF